MQTVRDDAGNRYLLLKHSDESSLVRDPDTGEKRYLDNADLSPAEGVSVLSVAAAEVDGSVRRVLSAVHDDDGLGLLVVLSQRGPLPVRELLDLGDDCESDLHGLLGELAAAGLIEERRIAGERGYGTTDLAEDALSSLGGRAFSG